MRAGHEQDGNYSVGLCHFMNLAVPQAGNQRSLMSTRFIPCILVLLPLVLAAGCKHFESESLPAATDAINSTARSLEDPGLRVFVEERLNRRFDTWPAKVWDFPALTLAAWYLNPSLDLARTQSGAQPSALSGELSEPARLHARTLAWQVRAGVRTNLLDYVATLRLEALLRDLETTQVELVRLGDQRRDGDAISQLELSFLRLQLARTRLALVIMIRDKMDDRARLAESVGLPVSALFEVEVAFDLSRTANSSLDVTILRQQTLHSRSDFVNALNDYAAAEAALRVEVTRGHPNIWFPAGLAWDRTKNRWVVNLRLDLPGVDLNRRRVANAEAHRVAAAAHLLNLQTDIIDDLETAVANYQAALERSVHVERLIAALRQQSADVVAQWKAGAATRAEVLLTQLQLEAAEVLNLEAQVKLQGALGLLEDKAQRPAESMDLPFLRP